MYALPLLLEAVLLLCFGRSRGPRSAPPHITGIVTDIGIECGRLRYWNHPAKQEPRVLADRRRVRMLVALAGSFFIGGLIGAFAFRHVGYRSTVPLAVVLLALACVPAFDDMRSRWLNAGQSRRLTRRNADRRGLPTVDFALKGTSCRS